MLSIPKWLMTLMTFNWTYFSCTCNFFYHDFTVKQQVFKLIRPWSHKKIIIFLCFFQPEKRSLQFFLPWWTFFLPPALVVRSNWHGQSAARMPPPRPRVLVDARQKFVHLLRSRKLRRRSEGQPGKHAGNLARRNHFKLLYFEWSPPWHVGWWLSGGGCQGELEVLFAQLG